MKTTSFFLILIVAVLTSCTTGPSNSELKAKNDTLLLALSEKDRMHNELVNSLIEIDENLAIIKEKENIISLNSAEAVNNNGIKDQINQDIKLIYDLMVQNQEKIAQLEKQLKSSNRDNANNKKLIASLNEQLKEKSLEIIMLTEQLKAKNIQIDELNFAVEGLKGSLDSLRTQHSSTTKKLEETTIDLYTVHYVIGSSKELKDKNIINGEGFLNLKKKVLNQDFDTENFTEADSRETEQIATFKKRVKIMTNHPQNSYAIIDGADGSKIISIKDKNLFWSVSKFLVVQVN